MNRVRVKRIRLTIRPIILAILFLLLAQRAPAAEVLQEIIEQRHSLDPAGTLSIHDRDGSIQVYGSELPEISIKAIKKAYTQARLKEIVVDLKVAPAGVAIETIIPPKKGGLDLSDRSGTVEYIVTVPQTIRITKLDLVNGEMLVAGLRGGSAKAHLVNGVLTARNCFGDLDLTMVNGRLEVVYDWWDPKRFSVKASSQKGSIRAILPSDASAAVVAHASNGWILNGFETSKSEPVEPVHVMKIAIGTKLEANFELTAADGNIQVDKTY